MVVDDNAGVLATLERIISEWGFETVPFGEFEDAREYLLTNPPLHALVVDIRLGDYNGLQLMHLARQSSPSLIIVAISGFDDRVLRKEAERIGVAYVLKPTELMNLRQHLSPSA
jgi:two-component system response regulator RegA